MYRYETHMHTCQASACGVSTGKEHAQAYHALGYQGIIITDHFFGGNSSIDRSLSWKERIRLFASGYQDAKEEGDKLGLDVFFAWEETIDGDDYLVYGLSPEWMLEHPEMQTWTRKEQYEAVRAAGGCVVQAHPFRQRDYLKQILLTPHFVDGVEVANAGNHPIEDACAMRYAQELGLSMTAGSDNHRSRPEAVLFGVELEQRLTCIGDYVDLILKKQPMKLIADDRFHFPADEKLYLACFSFDQEEKLHPYRRDWLPEGKEAKLSELQLYRTQLSY